MLKIKVCGMKYPENIRQLIELQTDYMGFIFYPKSPRYCPDFISEKLMDEIPETIQKVGVFVNEKLETTIETVEKFGLNLIQLHGNEPVDYCQELKILGYQLIKAFQVDNSFDFKATKPYKKISDYFLFDTKSDKYGGSGKQFQWDILKNYDNEKPFFLSGGIDVSDIDKILNLNNINIHCIDINSKFETEAGKKDIIKVKKFLKELDNLKMRQLDNLKMRQLDNDLMTNDKFLKRENDEEL